MSRNALVNKRLVIADTGPPDRKSPITNCLLPALVLVFLLAAAADAQTKTTVTDTLYSPAGIALSGAITITNNATFTAADGTVVPKGAIAAVTVTNGAFSVTLVPNEGSAPSGSSYNAVYKLGQTYLSETWVVPASATPVGLAAVRTAPAPSPAVRIADSQLPATIAHSALEDKGGQVFGVKAYGAVGDGSTDDTAAVQAAIDAASTNGGIVFFSSGVYLVAGALRIPNSDGANPRQWPLRLTGAGADSQTTGAYPAAMYGSVLNLTYGSGTAKLYTTGIGKLEIDHLTLEDTGGDDVPFVVTTNTTLHIHNCSFLGSKSGTAADQDAIWLGDGTNLFQGYGTVIRDNFFDDTRRAVYLRKGANAVQVVENTVWLHSGSNLAGGAAIEIDGTGDQAAGNNISGNLIEMAGYANGVKLIRANGNHIAGNSFWDGGAQSVGAVYLDANSGYNTVSCSLTSGLYCPDPAGNPPSTNTILNSDINTGLDYLPNKLRLNTSPGAANAGYLDVWGDLNWPIAVAHADSTLAAPSQLTVRGSTDWSQEVHIGYNTTSNYGSIEAVHTGVANVPLLLQPQGGVVGVGASTPYAAFNVSGTIRTVPADFSTLWPCNSATEGSRAAVDDSTTATWGDPIAGGGSHHVLAYCNGANWTVAGR